MSLPRGWKAGVLFGLGVGSLTQWMWSTPWRQDGSAAPQCVWCMSVVGSYLAGTWVILSNMRGEVGKGDVSIQYCTPDGCRRSCHHAIPRDHICHSKWAQTVDQNPKVTLFLSWPVEAPLQKPTWQEAAQATPLPEEAKQNGLRLRLLGLLCSKPSSF